MTTDALVHRSIDGHFSECRHNCIDACTQDTVGNENASGATSRQGRATVNDETGAGRTSNGKHVDISHFETTLQLRLHLSGQGSVAICASPSLRTKAHVDRSHIVSFDSHFLKHDVDANTIDLGVKQMCQKEERHCYPLRIFGRPPSR